METSGDEGEEHLRLLLEEHLGPGVHVSEAESLGSQIRPLTTMEATLAHAVKIWQNRHRDAAARLRRVSTVVEWWDSLPEPQDPEIGRWVEEALAFVASVRASLTDD